ncbi:MAG: hypothetical protein RL001_2016 [Pseudomonadota bacterium]|jgi:hypothetical protein|nr:hypothetical protein [Oxalobacteraceae bacterium]
MRKPLTLLFTLVVILLLCLAAYTWLVLNWSYSSGERAGLLQKFSRKGWVCKTWEGELMLTAMPGAIPEKFEFTVRDDQLAAELSANAGKKIVLSYSQHKGLPSSCFGDTEYFAQQMQQFQDQ